jgi:hypothetical protein
VLKSQAMWHTPVILASWESEISRIIGYKASLDKKFLFFFFCRLGFELRAYTLNHSTSPIFVIFFEIGSLELFAWAGL